MLKEGRVCHRMEIGVMEVTTSRLEAASILTLHRSCIYLHRQILSSPLCEIAP